MVDSSLPRAPTADVRSSTLVGVLIGIAIMAAVDEIVFHQLLAWHHFYDRSTPRWRCSRTGCCTPPR